ncbi:hypothetical protein [uncultured Clostridium sp.]|uniref:hypothetical protein n=1 Tax=uncultured Clostridium sp. TaxID=59620 RepID=UPI002630BCEE|nr:hypothetical protein [uncultured Clostridium sp.]
MEEIMERAYELCDLIAKEKDNISGTGNSKLYWTFEEGETALSSVIEQIENLLKG